MSTSLLLLVGSMLLTAFAAGMAVGMVTRQQDDSYIYGQTAACAAAVLCAYFPAWWARGDPVREVEAETWFFFLLIPAIAIGLSVGAIAVALARRLRGGSIRRERP
jgi:hypothetical protein